MTDTVTAIHQKQITVRNPAVVSTSLQRIVRTSAAGLAAFLSAWQLLQPMLGISNTQAAKVAGIVAVLVVLWNAAYIIAEDFGILPNWMRGIPAMPEVGGSVASNTAAAATVAPTVVKDVAKVVAAAPVVAEAVKTTETAAATPAPAPVAKKPRAKKVVVAPVVTPVAETPAPVATAPAAAPTATPTA